MAFVNRIVDQNHIVPDVAVLVAGREMIKPVGFDEFLDPGEVFLFFFSLICDSDYE